MCRVKLMVQPVGRRHSRINVDTISIRSGYLGR
jgi:hypothetical protein